MFMIIENYTVAYNGYIYTWMFEAHGCIKFCHANNNK